MHFDISDASSDFIERKIADGAFPSANAVVEAALNRWASDELDLEPGEMDALLEPALKQVQAGEVSSLHEALSELETYKKKSWQVGAAHEDDCRYRRR